MGLDEKIQENVNKAISEYFEKNNLKEKKFRYPFGKKVGKSQKSKNYVTLILLKDNGRIDYKKYQIKDQTIIHDTIPRLANAGYVFHDKKNNPVIILPEWSVRPISAIENYQLSLEDGSNINGYKILMNAMISNKTDEKKKMGKIAGWIIGIVVIGIIIFALLSGGGN